MSNMSYCRFRNTMMDLEDCLNHLYDPLDPETDDEEIRARKHLVLLCRAIAEETDDEYEDEQ